MNTILKNVILIMNRNVIPIIATTKNTYRNTTSNTMGNTIGNIMATMSTTSMSTKPHIVRVALISIAMRNMENTTMIIMGMEDIMIATENIMKCIIMHIPKTIATVILLIDVVFIS
jgi:hypothetical protein